MNPLYFPIIKTRDAELRAMEKLSADTKRLICPIYELTKSRKTSKVPDGDIHRRMSQLAEIQGEDEFILDLSTDKNYINPQIEQLLLPDHGFNEWYLFIAENHRELNIIPMVHVYEDEDGVADEVKSFVSKISAIKRKIAVRLPHNLTMPQINQCLDAITQSMDGSCKLIVIFDANFVDRNNESINRVIGSFIECCVATEMFNQYLSDVVVVSSTFPSDVKSAGNHDSTGEFYVYEEDIYQAVKADQNTPNVSYGDYASINTEQIEMRGGTFVPRIDIAYVENERDKFFYKRYRRDDGSYPRCAREVLADRRYINGQNWSNEEIRNASVDKPSGISPAYWISVRMEYYINLKVDRRKVDLNSPER
ncbi:beta family protein [Alteromonas flava]|uniref:beta family protein n=1 Tax=Alteromonas flava TaxID=2048003 RepID=UPI000C2905D3|nr:beta family protein [Alteromonas flava]